jgi:hypothetical protein
MLIRTAIVVGFVMQVNAINSIHAAGPVEITASEHIFNELPDHGCVVLDT